MSTLARPVPFSLVLALLLGVVAGGVRTLGLDVALGPALEELGKAEQAQSAGRRQSALITTHNQKMQEVTDDLLAKRVTFQQALGRVAQFEEELLRSGGSLPGADDPGHGPDERRGRKLIAWVVSRREVAGRREEARAWHRRLEAELTVVLRGASPASQ